MDSWHIHPVRGESYRRGKRFVCGHCGWAGDADLNGAKNIQTLGATVNRPEGSGWGCSLVDHVRLRAVESSVLYRGEVYKSCDSSFLPRPVFQSWKEEEKEVDKS